MTDLPSAKQNQDDQNKQTPITPGVGKEREGKQEITPMTEYTRKVDLEPEVEGWLEKLEKEDSRLQQPVTDDKGKIILDDAAKQKKGFKVVLPLTKDEVDKGLHHKVIDSIRCVAEWCIRMIKMFGSKVSYRNQ